MLFKHSCFGAQTLPCELTKKLYISSCFRMITKPLVHMLTIFWNLKISGTSCCSTAAGLLTKKCDSKWKKKSQIKFNFYISVLSQRTHYYLADLFFSFLLLFSVIFKWKSQMGSERDSDTLFFVASKVLVDQNNWWLLWHLPGYCSKYDQS